MTAVETLKRYRTMFGTIAAIGPRSTSWWSTVSTPRPFANGCDSKMLRMGSISPCYAVIRSVS